MSITFLNYMNVNQYQKYHKNTRNMKKGILASNIGALPILQEWRVAIVASPPWWLFWDAGCWPWQRPQSWWWWLYCRDNGAGADADADEGNGVEVEMQVHDLGRGDSQRITPVLVGLSLLSNWQTSIVDTWLLLWQ